MGVSVVFSRLWPIELLTHFRLQEMAGLLVLSLLFLFLKQFRVTISLLILTIFSMLLVPGFHSESPRESPVETGTVVKILHLNTSARQKPVIRALNRSPSQPDLVLLNEAPKQIESYLRKHQREYKKFFTLFKGEDELAVISKKPLKNKDVVKLKGINQHLLQMTVPVRNRDITIWMGHSAPPVFPYHFYRRNRFLRKLRRKLHSLHKPDVFVGDINVTPGSPYFQDIVSNSHWSYAGKGDPFLYTWHSQIPILSTALDHVLYRKPVTVKKHRVLPGVGSEHYPVYAELGLQH
ncbi:MAG: endonuclease/exonuclease/phosphatase family protein [bacterium]